jgi:hypothetical protein
MLYDIIHNIIYYVFFSIISVICVFYLTGLIINFIIYYNLIKLSCIIYADRCVRNFIHKYKNYYLDITMISGDVIKMVKLLDTNYEGNTTGILEYIDSTGDKGAILRGKLRNLQISDIHIDNNNWKQIQNKLRLPYDMIWYISKFVANNDYICDKLERSDDIKYYNSV